MDINKRLGEIENLISNSDNINIVSKAALTPIDITQNLESIHSEIEQRIDFISASIIKTAANSMKEIDKAILLFRDWMLHSTIVRIIGAGRARLAGSIPANRLAHGGARVYIQDDFIPMPHSIKGGGIIAVSASGKTRSVLDVLKNVREKGGNVKIVGMAHKNAQEFQNYCDTFIGIDEDTERDNPLQALADTGEQVICELLDAIVVAAGKLAGFDDTTWRIGREDIGPTGPYDLLKSDIDLGLMTTVI